MNARSQLAVAASLIAAVAIAPALAAQEREDAEKPEEKKVTVTLSPVNESGISGTAVLADAADAEEPRAHRVTLELSGLEAGQTYPAHVHGGSCEEGGGVVVALESVTAEGAMASATTILTPEMVAMAAAGDEPTEMAAEEGEGEEMEKPHGPLFIQVHLPDGTPAACGDVPMMEHEGHEKEGHEGH